jgi:hypothetical protein
MTSLNLNALIAFDILEMFRKKERNSIILKPSLGSKLTLLLVEEIFDDLLTHAVSTIKNK